MDQIQLISAGVMLAFIALLCLVGVNNARLRGRAFRRELAATRAGQYPPLVAYQRYSQANNRRSSGQTIVWRIVFFAVLLAFGYVMYTSMSAPESLGWFATLEAEDQYLFFFLLPVAVFVPLFVYRLLRAAWADTPAFVQLRGLPTGPSDLVTLQAKAFAASALPVALIIEAGAVCYALGVDGLFCIIGVFVAIIAFFVVLSRLGPTLTRWYYPSKPIEQTQWAEWGERAQAWSRLAGVPIHRVYVRETLKYGLADGVNSGRRPQTIFLSDVFLQNSDWRQRDALICLLLAISDRSRRQAAQRQSQRRNQRGQAAQPGRPNHPTQPDNTIRVSVPGLLFVIVAVVVIAVLLAFPDQLAQLLPFGGPLLILYLLPLLALAIALGLAVRSARLARRRGPPANNLYSESDAVAVSLCGDPLALMAAILGVNLLSGVVLDRRYLATLPSALDRIAALERSLTQPGSYSPWAAQPIPALTPVQMGPYTMSAPITPEAIAARPAGPVPTEPYPIMQSPWAAMPMLTTTYAQPVPAAPPNLYDSSQFPQPAEYPPPPETYQSPSPHAAPVAPPIRPPDVPLG